MKMRFTFTCVLTGVLCAAAVADYTITPLSDGSSSVVVGTGLSFDIEVVLDSDSGDTHNSAIYRVVFSAADVEYDTYVWVDPYMTGSIYDDSFPFIDMLDPPLSLDAEALSGPGYPEGVVDIELSNVLDEPEETFSEGILTTLTLRIPTGFPTDEPIFVCVEPDTIANGFEVVSTFTGPPLEVTVVLAGDCDGDGDVDVSDLVNVILRWGPCPDPPAECPCDIDGDGEVSVTDLVLVIQNWSP